MLAISHKARYQAGYCHSVRDMNTETTEQEKTISFLNCEIEKHNQQIRELQVATTQILQNPSIRDKSLRDLEAQLSNARIANEIAQEQQKMYRGTELEESTTNDAIASSARIRQLEKQIEATLQHNAEQSELEDAKRIELEQKIERLLLHRDNLQNMLSRIVNERDEQHYNEGKKIYQDCMRDYQQQKQAIAEQERQTEQKYQDLETLQFDILKKLDSYPELQRLFMQEHNVELSDGPIRVARAAIQYLDTLIADHLELESCHLSDGRHISEILSLTDQETLCNAYQGGLHNLLDKRAQLMDFEEQRKAELQESRSS